MRFLFINSSLVIFLVATVLVAIIVSLLVLLLVGEIEGESDNGPMVSPILIADELFLLSAMFSISIFVNTSSDWFGCYTSGIVGNINT